MIIDGSLIKTLDFDFLKEYCDYLKEDSVVEKPLPKCPPKCSSGLDTPPIATTPEPRFSDCESPNILDMFMYPQFDSEYKTDNITNRQLEEAAEFIHYSLLQESVSSKHKNLQHDAVNGVQTYQLVQQNTTTSKFVQNQYVSSMPTYQHVAYESASLMPEFQVQQHTTSGMMSAYNNHTVPTSATTSYQQQTPSKSYQQQQIIPSLSSQQNTPSLSCQKGIQRSASQHNISSLSYQQVRASTSYQQNIPSLSYQQVIQPPSSQQHVPSLYQQVVQPLSSQQHVPSLYQQGITSTSSLQNIPSPSYPQQHLAAPSLQLLRQQLTTAAIRIPPVSVPFNVSPQTSLLTNGISHQTTQGPTTTKGKGRRSGENIIETVWEVPQSTVNKRGRKRSATSATTDNGGSDQPPQTKQRASRGRASGNSQQLPFSSSAQPNGHTGAPNSMLLSHQQLFPALAQLLCQPNGAQHSNSQNQYGQHRNRSAENVNGGSSHVGQSEISVGNNLQSKLPGTSGQIMYYQMNSTNTTNNSQPVTLQNIGQVRNHREPVVISLDNQRCMIQGYSPGMSGYVTTPLLSNYQNGLQISPQSSNTVNSVQFFPQHRRNILTQQQFGMQQNNSDQSQQQLMQQDTSNLPQQPFVVNLMTPPDSNLTPSPISSSTPSPEVLSSVQDYSQLKYRLM